MTGPRPEARTALLAALEAVGGYRAGLDPGGMPRLTHDETVALAGIASTALEALAERGGDPDRLLRLIYAAAHGINAAASS